MTETIADECQSMTNKTSAGPAKQKPEVFFMRVTDNEDANLLAEKTEILLGAARLAGIVRPKTLVAVKQHFGERGNQGFIKPAVSKIVGAAI